MVKNKSNKNLRETLSPEAYHVTQEKGTERPFSGEYDQCFEQGSYQCVCCGEDLFSSKDKFDAGCGWPSFSQPVNDRVIAEYEDSSLPGRPRVEVTCDHCGAHLGHVFEDGPKPTGLRYCINSVALNLKRSKS